ncbi:hypothetical protein Dsin_008688 [Dipteronia sinensis]|uniref:Uncharacterized protein n=1 Tax=Dipteronia sinensis TaxID=43782 RepID=A0AAE0EAX4_9ROSI|nr:hypothetical protein Dsin_008688 [Dipteronia sinensis]
MPVSPNGFPVSPNGVPVMPNGYPASINGLPVTQNGFPTSPFGSVDSPSIVTVDVGAEAVAENIESLGDEKSSTENKDEKQPVEEKLPEDQPVHNESAHPVIDEKPTNIAPVASGIVVTKENCNDKPQPVKVESGKCWGDYSDSEAEVVEVPS